MIFQVSIWETDQWNQKRRTSSEIFETVKPICVASELLEHGTTSLEMLEEKDHWNQIWQMSRPFFETTTPNYFAPEFLQEVLLHWRYIVRRSAIMSKQ